MGLKEKWKRAFDYGRRLVAAGLITAGFFLLVSRIPPTAPEGSPYALLPGPPPVSTQAAPDFRDRRVGTPRPTEAWTDWRARQRLHSDLHPHHNLHRLLENDRLADHPEWFPLLDGKRRPLAGGRGPQPNLADPGFARHVAEQVRAHWETHPRDPAFSISITDSTRFDESDATRAVVEPMRYFRGKPDYTDLVFQFADRVARQVWPQDQSPPGSPGGRRYLLAYAYYWAQNAPDFPLHPNLIPFLASDRMQGWDPDFVENEKALLRRWSGAGPAFLGARDYFNGEGYFIPRHAPSLIADSLKVLHAHNVRAYFAEGRPVWGFDAPRYWLAAQLLWEVDQDQATLMEHFFEAMYGPAAEPMQTFFNRCEAIWLDQEGSWQWLKYFRHPSQAELFTPETCAELAALLDQAWAEADGHPLLRRRIALTRDAFAFTRAASEYYFAWKALARNPLRTESDHNRFAENLETYNRKRKTLSSLPDIRGPHTYWSARERLLILQPEDRLHFIEQVDNDVGPAVPDTAGPAKTTFPFTDKQLPGDITGLDAWAVRNATLPDGLKMAAEPTEDYAFRRIPGAGADGDAVEIRGSNYTSLYTWQPVEPGQTYAAAARVRGKIQPGAWTGLYLAYYDADHNPLGVESMDETAPGAYRHWIPLATIHRAPEKAAWAFVALKVLKQQPGDWVLIDSLQFGVHP